MKNLVLIIVIIVLGTSGAIVYTKNKVQETGAKFFEDAKTSIENVVDEANEIAESVSDAKEKLDETVEDIEAAFEKIEETKEALSEITE